MNLRVNADISTPAMFFYVNDMFISDDVRNALLGNRVRSHDRVEV